MSNCLQQIYCGERTIIGVRDYIDNVKPESNLWVNNLPGMSLAKAANIAGPEYANARDFLREKIKLGTQKIAARFTEIIAPHFNFNAILKARDLNYFNDTVLPVYSGNRGLVLKRWRSEVAQIFIESIYVKTASTGEATISIIDGDVTKTYIIDLVPGQIKRYPIRYRASSEDVRIEMDNSIFEMYTGDLTQFNKCSIGCRGSRMKNDLFVTGWDGAKEVSKYYGIGVDASIQCYEDMVLCRLLPRMYFMMWYQAGVEICDEVLFGDRINPVVTFGKDKAEKLKKMYEEEILSTEKVFKTNAMSFLRSFRSDCLTCKGDHYDQSTP